jgi:deazaflavin-dependent oxidoreductase (nitroreductase family)
LNRVSRPALRGSLLGTLLRIWNPAMKLILRSPLHWPLSRWFTVLSWTGRKSGRQYATPVSYVMDGEAVWVTTGDRWWHNVEGGGLVDLRLRGRHRQATATPITDITAAAAEHQRLFREHPWFRRLSGIPGDGAGGADPVALERAISAGRTLVRMELGRRHPPRIIGR